MIISEMFPSKYLKAGDLPEDGDLVVTIVKCEMETVGNDAPEAKAVVYFRELPNKGLVLNKTNAVTIQNIYGPDTDLWIGKKIAVYVTEVQYAGKTMLGVRVRLKAPVKKAVVLPVAPEEAY